MSATLKSSPPPAGQGGETPASPREAWTDRITGRFRRITVHQLTLAWWLYKARHITMRQLRVYFAAHEMAERRRYTKDAERPLYGLDEIKALVGGRGTRTADRDLSADVKALGRIGLVKIKAHAIDFAVSVDQIAVDDVSGFWSMFEAIDNRRRTVPVPRRTCRALAGGLRPAMMAVVVALMIRGLYWHRPQKNVGEQGGSSGRYRVDGSTKRAWIAEVFGVSERAVTDARATLIELGWITPDDQQPQWHRNRYGVRDRINVQAFGPEKQVQDAGESASPTADKSGQPASPCLNSSSSLSGNLNTRKPAPVRAGPSGVSIETRKGSRKKSGEPTLRDITDEDLRDTGRMIELHRQAVAQGVPVAGEAGRLDFLALAERARACGNNPPKLFAWLLKQRRFEFITQANEDAAARRLRELRDGPRQRGRGVDPLYARPKPKPIKLTEDDKVVIACIQTAKQRRGIEPFQLARQVKNWTRDRWDLAHEAYEQKDAARWSRD